MSAPAVNREQSLARQPERSDPPVVEIKGVSKTYEPFSWWMRILIRSQVKQPVRALTDVSFAVWPGEACVVVGPNGAGKSTLFRILTGLTTPTTGSATVMGMDVQHQSRLARKSIGFMPSDDRSLFLRHSCRANLRFHGELQAIPKRELNGRIDEVLDMVGLGYAADRISFALSSGMRARLQIARALLHRPRVLILDEPTGTIDPVEAHRLLGLIETLTHEERLAVLISSHRLEEIDALHDNVAFLDRGHLVHWGDVHSLRKLWERRRVVMRFRDPDLGSLLARKLEAMSGVDHVEATAESLAVSTELAAGALLRGLGEHIVELEAVETEQMPLRDVLARLADQGAKSR